MKKIILYLIFSLSVTVIYGQVPTTWKVDPSAYSNSMVLTVVLNVNSQESRNPDDLVVAFLNNEIRGVAAPITYVKSKDRYIANLIVYSNDNNGQLITFKLYNKNRDVVSEAVTLPIAFEGDSKLGSYDEPIVIKDNNIPSDIFLSSDVVSENNPISTLVGNITVADDDAKDLHTISFLDGLGFEDNALFEIINGNLYTNAIFDFEQKNTYKIRIQAEDDRNGIVFKSFEIRIENKIEGVIEFNNIITPNNDGRNDFLVINNIDLYTNYDISIFNTIGQLVFNSVNYRNNWSGSELKSGVYYLYFTGKDQQGDIFNYKEALRIINY